ncbi:hypothetical protein BDF20DRAFT_811062 [Mycotypha africana]|uniref:uncharacterized protein n=1 Tax=Mycotypha africana TaxID=64632 RepID=UPI0023006D8C|nr:uncharacterized protein BDF20DRAFT_811062 [Mycotypha africana]KAI8991069.1 hypothetical protein BDF20DRAFT_811062 [Mycotypha africana]
MGKRKSKSSETETDATAVTLAPSVEESFPRGGASALTPLEHREIANKAAQDLFSSKTEDSTEDAAEPAKKKRKPLKKTKKTTPVKQTKPKSDRAYIEQLNFKKLTVGTSFLGCISRINELDLFVSLPHQLVGVVAITEISDALTAMVEKAANEDENMEDSDDDDSNDISLPKLDKLFRVGQWVRCKVIALQSENKKMIELTLNPSKVNEDVPKIDITPGITLGATVQSVEDHGYILDLGVKDLAGFLPMKESESYVKQYNRNEELVVGQYVECVVEKAAGRTVNVSIDRSKIASAVVEAPFSSIVSILPGQLVQGNVQAVQNNGLAVKMQGLYSTTIDMSHIPTSKDIENDYKLGQNITFRTLFTILNTDEKKIGGTLLSHALELDVPSLTDNQKSDKFVADLFPAGSFLDNVKVARANNTGIWATLDKVTGVSGFVHISRLADERIANITPTSGKFKIGSVHRARVLSYNPVDALLVLSLQPSVLAEKYLRITDIEVGSDIECEIEKLIDAGILVKISKSISGLVPAIHMADVKLTRPELKFKPGKKITCRVFRIDPVKQKVFLTLKKSLINSEYPLFKDIRDLKVDDVSHGVIVAIRSNGCIVSFYNGVSAFAPGSEMTETHVKDFKEVFNIGQTVKATVLTVNPEEGKLLVSFINSKKKAEKQAASKARLEAKHEAKNDALAPGKIVTATIKSIKKTHINLILPGDFEGRLHASEVYNNMSDITNLKAPLSQFKTKQEIQVRILGVRNIKLKTYLPITHAAKVKQHLECSLKLESNDDGSSRELRNLKVGDEFMGFVSDIHSGYALVSISSHTTGVLHKQLASADPTICNDLSKHFVAGQAIRAIVMSVDANKETIEFMNLDDEKTPRITSISDVEVGQVLNGIVKSVNKVTGLNVHLLNKLHAKVYLTDIADTYTEDPTAAYKEGDVVRMAIIGVNKERGQIDASLRPSRIYPDIESNEVKSFSDIKRGNVYEGYVSNVSSVGVFVKLNHNIAARVKIANLSDSFVKEWKDIYKLGQLVKAKIIYIDYDMQRLEASLKTSVVEGTSNPAGEKKKAQHHIESDSDEEMPEVDESDSDEEMQDVSANEEDESDGEDEEKEENAIASDGGNDSGEEDAEEDQEAAPTPALKIDNFDWTGINNRPDSSDEEEEDSDDEDDEDSTKSKKKKNQKQEVEDITAELNTNAPQTANDYERLLVGSPNSSYLWINYMAYQLQLSEISKARDIGERALKTINFREEQEKLNVWVALLNLENNFGTEESLQEVFKRALIYCEPIKVYKQLVKIYERSDKQDKAEALYEEMTKKFGQLPEVWTGFGLYCLQNDKVEKARELLQQSLKVLPKFEHVQTIVKFGQMEFKHGEPERGRTILEGVLSNYPKRLDLWNIYLDMEIKTDVEKAR